MRQAGRSLPEYHELRTRARDFIAFCHDPEMAAEATLQPMRRFPMDAAIVFADILLLPRALGQTVWFEAGEGPRLGPLPSLEALEAEVDASTGRLASIGETLHQVRSTLEPDRALIGFAGGPWTVATYMLEGRGGDRAKSRALAVEDPELVDGLIDILARSSAAYLDHAGSRAGAQVLQLFESWAELLPENDFERLVTRPPSSHRRAVARGRESRRRSSAFRAAVALWSRAMPRGAGVEGVGLDVQAPASISADACRPRSPSRAPSIPFSSAPADPRLDRPRRDSCSSNGPVVRHIFNLGHGVSAGHTRSRTSNRWCERVRGYVSRARRCALQPGRAGWTRAAVRSRSSTTCSRTPRSSACLPGHTCVNR